MTALNVQAIPAELKALDQWLLWQWEQRTDPRTREVKLTKVPYQPSGALAEVDNPETWSPFEVVLKAYQSGRFSGMGFVLTEDDDVVGFDLDHCRDPKTGAIEEWAQNIVNRVDSYTDITPSNEGLRIFARGKLPPKDRRIGQFECYDSGRYLTVPGNHLPGTPTTVEHRQAEMNAVHTEMFAERNKPRTNGKVGSPLALPNLDDKEVLDKAFNAKNGEDIWRLYHGDTSKYGSPSEADLAFCSKVAFWAGPDPQKIDRIFRTSDLYRHKWDDARGDTTYGQMTIAKALEGNREYYSPNGNGSNGHKPGSIAPPPAQPKWPDTLAPQAFYGLVGDIVRAIAPHIEADPAALLVNCLVAFGNASGSGPHGKAEADRHGTNLFATLVGSTSKGRKGSSWGHIRELFSRVDPE
jgi:putative DNA primase/helicase